MPTTGNSPISLYFHIPFCTKKCHYCHFFVLPDKIQYHEQLLNALCLDIDIWGPQLAGKKLESIYFGGGTPSLLSPQELERLLKHVERYLPIDRDSIEITLEANPETVTVERMQAFADVGINRVSIGVQSLDDVLLQKLGRTHGSRLSIDAVNNTAKAGIRNMSVDLMYDIPGQTLASWRATLAGITILPITHLSLYNLTIEPHTVFFKYQESLRKELPDADSSTAMYCLAQEAFENAGLSQYEISAFARPGMPSRHNTGYWTARPFLGFGPSAFSYWEGKRFRAVANLNRYDEAVKNGKSPIDFSEELPPHAKRCELLAIALRLKQGVDIQSFENLHGTLSDDTHQTIKKLCAEGLLFLDGAVVSMTPKGMLFYDTIATDIV